MPLGYSEVADMDMATQIEVGMASVDYKWHWSEGGYDPWWPNKEHKKQQEFHALKAAFRAFIGGVGSGKTLGGAAEAVKQAIEQPGSVGIVAAPTYKMLQQSTKQEFYKVLQRTAIHRRNDADNVIELTNGSMIWFRSTEDPETIRGINATWFWLDEGAYSSGKAWDVLVGRLRQPGYKHMGWVTTTPRGKNWLWERFASPKAPPGYKWVRSSSKDNPWLTEEFYANLQATYGMGTTFFRQDVEGEFTINEGLVYPMFDPLEHVIEEVTPDLLKRMKQYIAGVDWGYRNLAVVLVFGLDSDDRMYAVDEWAVSHALIDDQVEAAKEFQRKYGKMKFVCDPSEPGFIKTFNNAGLWAVEANNSIMPGIKEVSARLAKQGDDRPRLFIAKQCSETIEEFTKYAYPENKEGKPVKEEPVKEFDHCMDALRYAVMSVKQNARWTLNRGLDRIV